MNIALQKYTARIPSIAWVVAGLLLLLSCLGPNYGLTLFAVGVLLAGIRLLWRPGESPILLFVFGVQWLQASVMAFQANVSGKAIAELSRYGGDVWLASFLSLTGLLVLAIGMRFGVGRQAAGPWRAARDTAMKHGMVRWFKLYLLAVGVSFAAKFASGWMPGLSQPLLALANLKWACFFMLTYAAFLRPHNRRNLWLIAFTLEFALGFGGYFSSFKHVLLFSIMGIVAAGVRFTPARVILLSAVGSMTVVFLIIWSVVKEDYRDYLSGGTNAQVVTVSYTESLSKLGEMVMTLDAQSLIHGSKLLAQRATYVSFFGSALDYVPNVVPHSHGAIWLDAITRPFMPRVLFPEKSAIHDSERTRKYTGLWVAGVDQGTSISIGYMGESYIDFGPVFMMVPLLAFGWLLGRSYRWMVGRAASKGLLGMGLASAVLFGAAYLESSITKVSGGLVAALLVVWCLNRFVLPRYFGWLRAGGTGKVRPELQPAAH